MIILDNSPLSYIKQTKNGIPIRSWYSDKKDKDLFNLIPILVNLSKFYDVTTELPKFVSNNTLIFSKAYLWFNENRMELDANTNDHLNLIAENFNIKPKHTDIRSSSHKNIESATANKLSKPNENRNESKLKATLPVSIQKHMINKLLNNGVNTPIVDAFSTKNAFGSLIEKSKLKKISLPSKKDQQKEELQKSTCPIIKSESTDKDLLMPPSDLSKKRKKQNSDIIHENRSNSKKVIIKTKEDSAQTTKHSIASTTLYNLKYSIAQETPISTNTSKPGNLKYQSINCFRMNESLSTKNFNLRSNIIKAESKQKSESFNFNFNTFNSFCGGAAILSNQALKKPAATPLEININSISSIIQGNPSKTSTFKMQGKHKASVSLVSKDFSNTTASKIGGANESMKANQTANTENSRGVETRSQHKLKSHSINIKKASLGVKLIESPVKSRN